MASKSVRYNFDSLESAAEALIVLLKDALASSVWYRFSGLTAQQALTGGILLEGDIDDVCIKLDKVPGSVKTDE